MQLINSPKLPALSQNAYIPLKVILFIGFLTLKFASVYALGKQESPQQNELIEKIKASDHSESEIYEDTLLKQQHSNTAFAEIYLDIGISFYKNGNYKRSLDYIHKAISWAEKAKDWKLLCEAYLKQGNSYLLDWQNQDALEAYHKVLEISKKIKNKEKEVIAKVNIAIIRNRMKQYDKAVEACTEALGIVDNTTLKNGKNHVNLLTIASESYLGMEEYDKALGVAEMGIKISDSIGYSKGLTDLYTKIGVVHCKQKNYTSGFKYFDKAEDIIASKPIKERYFLQNIRYYRARSYHDLRQFKQAIAQLLRFVHHSENDTGKITIRTVEAYRLLADSYKQYGDKDNSIFWYDKYIRLNDRFLESKYHLVNKIYESDTKQLGKEIAALKREKIQQKKNNTTILRLTLVLFIGSFFFLFYTFKKQEEKKKKLTTSPALNMGVPLESSLRENTPKSPKEIVIHDDTVDDVLKRLEKLEHQEYFLDLECNLRTMAKKVKTNATYLSVIINNHKNKKFITYINDLRINYTLERLHNDKKFRSFSIKSIAKEVGYKSDYSFAKHFKSKTGVNPSDYIKKLGNLGSV